MSTELEKQGQGALAPTKTMYEVFADMARDPSIEPARLGQLMELQERAEKRNAEKEFTAAFARLKFPPFIKNRKGHSAKYAAFEDIQRVIDPILEAEGFTLTYSSGQVNEKGLIPTYGLLSHVGGFSRPGEVWLPPDGVATRSGGMNMNALQAVGSSMSYGQRYCAKLMLNLRFIGEDDDGAATSALTAQQREHIDNLLFELGDAELIPFLKFLDVKALGDIQRAAYAPAMGYLQAKRKRMGAK